MKNILQTPSRLTFLAGMVLSGLLLVLGLQSQDMSSTPAYIGTATCLSAGCHVDGTMNGFAGKDAFLGTVHAQTLHAPSLDSLHLLSLFPSHSDRDIVIDTLLPLSENDIQKDQFNNGESPLPERLGLRLRMNGDEWEAMLSLSGERIDSTEWMPLEFVMGGNGWMERYVVRLAENRYPLPFEFVFSHYRNSEGKGVLKLVNTDRWVARDPLSGELTLRRPEEPEFMGHSWDRECAGCHTGPMTSVKMENGKGEENWKTVNQVIGASPDRLEQMIGCESCHGPGSLHAADPTSRELIDSLHPGHWTFGNVGTREYWTDRRLDLCDQCHTRTLSTDGVHQFPFNDAGERGFRPKDDLAFYIQDPTGDADYWPDGLSAHAHHQTGQDYRRSKHYQKNIFTQGCYSCHEVHQRTDQPYMLDRDWYTLTRGKGCVATGCHSGFALTTTKDGILYNAHTKHRQEHSQCVNCHYTRVATFGGIGHNEFSDHSDMVIRPLATLTLQNQSPQGMPSTCALSCHRNGYGDRNRPDSFLKVIDGEAMRAPDFGIVDSLPDVWNEPSDLALADSLWEGFKRLYPEFVGGVATGEEVAGDSRLTRLAPNPAVEKTTISYLLSQPMTITIEAFDMKGRLVRRIVSWQEERGSYRVEWDLRDEAGVGLADGIYMIRMSDQANVTLGRVLPLYVGR